MPIKEINSCVPVEIEHGIVAEPARQQVNQEPTKQTSFLMQLVEASFAWTLSWRPTP